MILRFRLAVRLVAGERDMFGLFHLDVQPNENYKMNNLTSIIGMHVSSISILIFGKKKNGMKQKHFNLQTIM